MEGKPKIVVICGSSRFVEEMAVCAWLIERDENAICLSLHLLPWWYKAKESHLAEHEGVEKKMDMLHMAKIDISAEVFVLNRNDYTGASTNAEVMYAKALQKISDFGCVPKIRWYSHDPIGAECEEILRKVLKNGY